RERVLHHRQEARVVARLRDALRETDDDPRAHETLRLEGLPQICPRRGDRDRRERDAVDGGKPHHAAAVGDAERADPVRVDVRPRQEPVEELDRVLELTRPVEGEQPARLAVRARVEGDYRVAVRDEVRLRDAVRRPVADVERVSCLAEPVEHHDGGPAGRRRGSRRRVVGDGDPNAVAPRDRRVHFREVGGCDVWRRPRENGGSTDEGEGAEHRWPAYATDTIGGWIRGRWASSTRGWAGSPSSTSVWSRFRARASFICGPAPGYPNA